MPNVLAVQVRRYYVADDWTPKKLDVLVPMPEEINPEHLGGAGMRDDEVALPDEAEKADAADGADSAAPAAAVAVEPDPTIVAQVMSMGFSENASKRAALAVRNASAEHAMEWVFAHMEDADFNDPPTQWTRAPLRESTPRSSRVSTDVPTPSPSPCCSRWVSGRDTRRRRSSVRRKPERAADWLFSRADDLDGRRRRGGIHGGFEPKRRRRRGRCSYRWAVRRRTGRVRTLRRRESHGRKHRQADTTWRTSRRTGDGASSTTERWQ